jgi:hypothetical protein
MSDERLESFWNPFGSGLAMTLGDLYARVLAVQGDLGWAYFPGHEIDGARARERIEEAETAWSEARDARKWCAYCHGTGVDVDVTGDGVRISGPCDLCHGRGEF